MIVRVVCVQYVLYERTYSGVELSPPLQQSVIGGQSGAGVCEGGHGNAYWTGAAVVQVHL